MCVFFVYTFVCVFVCMFFSHICMRVWMCVFVILLYARFFHTFCKGILYYNINVLLNYDRVLIQCTIMCFSCYIGKQLHCVSVCYHEFDTLNSGHDQATTRSRPVHDLFQLILLMILLIIDKVLSGQLVGRRRCTGCFLLLIDNETRLFPVIKGYFWQLINVYVQT